MKRTTKYNSSVPATNWSNLIDNFFNHSLSNVIGSDMTASQPAVTVAETANHFRIELAVPGLEKKDFKINVEKDTLTILVKKEANKETTTAKFTRREFNYASFKRSFHLPEHVEVSGITAAYEQGILKVVVPKVADAADQSSKTIEIA